jgi:hypothetical protein
MRLYRVESLGVERKTNWKECRSKELCANCNSVPVFSWSLLRKPRNTWISVINILFEIRNGTPLPPTSLENKSEALPLALFVWNSILICPLSSYNSIHHSVCRPLLSFSRSPAAHMPVFSIVTKYCGSRQLYRISRCKLDWAVPDAKILTKRWRVITSGIVNSNF